jgi:hypothetical protein
VIDYSMRTAEGKGSVGPLNPADRTLARCPPALRADEDSLAAARGVLLGLACTVPMWLVLVLAVLN